MKVKGSRRRLRVNTGRLEEAWDVWCLLWVGENPWGIFENFSNWKQTRADKKFKNVFVCFNLSFLCSFFLNEFSISRLLSRHYPNFFLQILSQLPHVFSQSQKQTFFFLWSFHIFFCLSFTFCSKLANFFNFSTSAKHQQLPLNFPAEFNSYC